MNANPMNWGMKWALLIGASIVITASSCTKCDGGKAEILIAAYYLSPDGADSTLIDNAIIRMVCNTDQYPGGSAGLYDVIDTTDYTGKVEFEGLRRRQYFFYATANRDVSVNIEDGDTLWDDLLADSPLLWNTIWYTTHFPYSDSASIAELTDFKLYVKDIMNTQAISGTNTMEITNRQGETTLGIVLCPTGGTTCVDAN